MKYTQSHRLLYILASIVEREANHALAGGFRSLQREIEEGERKHRAFGRRLCRGVIGPRDSMQNVVRMFAAKVTFRESLPVHRNGSAAYTRRDWLMGEALYAGAWARTKKAGLRRPEVVAFVQSLDYPIAHSDKSNGVAKAILLRLDARDARKERSAGKKLAKVGGKCRQLPGTFYWRSRGQCTDGPSFSGGASELPSVWGTSGYMARKCLDLRARRATGPKCRIDARIDARALRISAFRFFRRGFETASEAATAFFDGAERPTAGEVCA